MSNPFGASDFVHNRNWPKPETDKLPPVIRHKNIFSILLLPLAFLLVGRDGSHTPSWPPPTFIQSFDDSPSWTENWKPAHRLVTLHWENPWQSPTHPFKCSSRQVQTCCRKLSCRNLISESILRLEEIGARMKIITQLLSPSLSFVWHKPSSCGGEFPNSVSLGSGHWTWIPRTNQYWNVTGSAG